MCVLEVIGDPSILSVIGLFIISVIDDSCLLLINKTRDKDKTYI